MSYSFSIPFAELGEYEVIPDWQAFLQEKSSQNQFFPMGVLELSKKIIESDMAFVGGTFNYSVTFKNCYFKKDVSFINAVCPQPINFFDCFIDGSFSAGMESVFSKSLSLYATKVQGCFMISDGIFNECSWMLTECDQLILIKGEFKKIDMILPTGSMKNLSIGSYNDQLTGAVNILGTGGAIDSFQLCGNSKELTLSISNLSVREFDISNFRNDSVLRISDIKALPQIEPGSVFSVSNSYMGTTEFNHVDLSAFAKVNLVDSHLVDCSFVNVTWPTSIEAFRNHTTPAGMHSDLLRKLKEKKYKRDADVRAYFGRQRETYRQLKYAMSKQGDIVNEQVFHSLEMQTFNRSIGLGNHIWTKTILKLSHLTSDFGQSIVRPVVCLVVIHYFLFSILVLGNYFPDLCFSPADGSWKGFVKGFNYFFETINPFRKTEAGRSFVLIDILMRVWASYMIYNFIRASRRFIK